MQVDTLTTGRTYHTPDGSFPSITTILGKTSPSRVWLEKWKNKVGEEEAARISKLATDRGTLIHDYAERHFNGETINMHNEDPSIRNMVNNLIRGVETGIEDIWGQEQILWSTKYRYAGRTDMVGVWKGKPAIIDFKTSKKVKYENEIRDYFIQCCSYAVAHNEMFGTGIKHGVIIMTVEDKKELIFEKELPPFLYELRQRRLDYDKMAF